jgi:DNA polymerase-3 subunit alpha
MACLEEVIARSAKMREETDAGQSSLFEMTELNKAATKPQATPLKAAGSWSDHELLGYEKEVLGFYLSGHPLARFQAELKMFSTHGLDKLPTSDNAGVRIAGMIGSVRRLVTKAKKEPYARCRFEDLLGEVDCVIFPKAYATLSKHLKPSEMMVITGRVNRRIEDGGAPEIIVEDMVPLAQARESYVSELLVRMSTPEVEERVLQELRETLARYPGRCRVCLEIPTAPDGKVIVETDLTVKPSQALFLEIEQHLGHESWQITRVGR